MEQCGIGVTDVAAVAHRGQDVLALVGQQREPRQLAGGRDVRQRLVRAPRRSARRAGPGPRPARPARRDARCRTRGSSRASGSRRPSSTGCSSDLSMSEASRSGTSSTDGVTDGGRARLGDAGREDRQLLGQAALVRSVSRSQLHSTTARSVRWRGSAVRLPPVSSRNRSDSRPAISSSGRVRSRAAASSMASGRPSRRRTISMTRRRRTHRRPRSPGGRPPARSANSRTAGYSSASAAPAVGAG